MSIAYFPRIYPDELIYSILCRYHIQTGYGHFTNSYIELFENERVNVDMEFVKQLRPEIVTLLTRKIKLEELLEKHTMYPYYGRFLDAERRNKAFNALLEMRGDFSKLFRVPRVKEGESRVLKYCPLCAKEDRAKYGETYWHRAHQVRELNICPIHSCYLQDSSISLDSRIIVKLVSAEEMVPLETEVLFCDNIKEIKLANYMIKVLEAPLNRDNNYEVSTFLHAKMQGTSYLSARGERVYSHRLWEGMQRYYKGVSGIECLTVQQVQSILIGRRMVYKDICMLAMFLNISAHELAEMKTPKKTPEQQFDEKVKEMLADGKGISQIAREMGVGTSIIWKTKEIINNPSGKRTYRGNINSSIDWGMLDKETLPLVQIAVSELRGVNGSRPKRVSISAVSRRLKIGYHRFMKMDLCRQCIESFYETDEQYFARKILWACEKLDKDGLPISCWRLCKLTKLEKSELAPSIPYLKEIAPPEVVEIVQSLL